MSFSHLLPSGNYINGQFHSEGAEHCTVINKYTQEPIATVPLATAAQVEVAISSAQAGFKAYKTWSAGKRSQLLHELANALQQEKSAFAELIAAEAGKPIAYAQNEVARCITTLTTAAAEGLRFSGETVPMDFGAGTGKTALTKRVPIGPITAIAPFNFPLNLALHKIAPALACGCSIVLKPSPLAPLSTLAFATLCAQTSLPEGTVNIVLAATSEAQTLVTDDRMKMLSFTGSPSIGWKLKSLAGKKKIALELGGNAAVLVARDADIVKAAKLTANGAFLYAGQICISTQRIYVEESVFEAYKTAFLAATKQLAVGDPMHTDVRVGPIISSEHLHRIDAWVQEAKTGGAEVLLGGMIADPERNVYVPTVLTNTTKGMKVVDEEVFGPVVILESVPDAEAGLAAINDSVFGLQAGVFTNQLSLMQRAHEVLEVGAVLMNNIPAFRVDSMPYGGVKDSGMGREGIRYAMEEMTEPRMLVY